MNIMSRLLLAVVHLINYFEGSVSISTILTDLFDWTIFSRKTAVLPMRNVFRVSLLFLFFIPPLFAIYFFSLARKQTVSNIHNFPTSTTSIVVDFFSTKKQHHSAPPDGARLICFLGSIGRVSSQWAICNWRGPGPPNFEKTTWDKKKKNNIRAKLRFLTWAFPWLSYV